jgi:hypothetical protein
MGITKFLFSSGVEEVLELYMKAIVAENWIDFIVEIANAYRDDIARLPDPGFLPV